MAFGVFIHRADSAYEDDPSRHYQFPTLYYSRAMQVVGDWVVYYEPTKVRGTKGYYAVARVQEIVPDPAVPGRFRALIEPNTYIEFPHPVPKRVGGATVETGLLNEAGKDSGRAQAAVRTLSPGDFGRILSLGLVDVDTLLPRTGALPGDALRPEFGEDAQVHFEIERQRVEGLTSRLVRDRVFRRLILRAYDERCCVTGLKLINGGGRAEVEAAHIRPVEANGPDRVQNGLALSGTVHWMFDRGLITFSDQHDIVISRHVNDRDSVEGLVNRTGRLIPPGDRRNWPHPAYLAWHRENRFKA